MDDDPTHFKWILVKYDHNSDTFPFYMNQANPMYLEDVACGL